MGRIAKRLMIAALIIWFSALQLGIIYYLREIADGTGWLSDINRHVRSVDPNPY